MPVSSLDRSAPADAGAAHPGLELLSTSVLLLDDDRVVRYANPAAENLFDAKIETAQTGDGLESYDQPQTLRVGLVLRR